MKFISLVEFAVLLWSSHSIIVLEVQRYNLKIIKNKNKNKNLHSRAHYRGQQVMWWPRYWTPSYRARSGAPLTIPTETRIFISICL